MALLDKFVRPAKTRPEEASKRAARIPTADLPAWAEQCGFEVGRMLQQYGRDHSPEALDAALYAAEGQLAIIDEMKRRHVNWQ